MRKPSALIALLAAPLIVGACGSSDSDDKPTEAIAASSTAFDDGEQPAQYVGKWSGHTRDLELDGDGTGTLNAYRNATNGENWTLTWTGDDENVQITLVDQDKLDGDGSGVEGLEPGATFTGELEEVQEGETLTVDGYKFCDEEADAAAVCGA